jgi:hypothetical protein
MEINTKPTRLDAFFKNVDLALFNNYFKTDNGVSAKSCHPSDDVNEGHNFSLQDQISLVIYSTGLCKLNFKVNKNQSVYKWNVRILDASKKNLLSFEFAPLIVESSNGSTSRQFKLERRFSQVNESLIEKASYVQLVNLPT